MAKLRERRRPHPKWGATKQQAKKNQLERDRLNRDFAFANRHTIPLGPANDAPLVVTQELVALFYAEEPAVLSFIVGTKEFSAGLSGEPPPDERRFIWETGALAAHLIEIGGQR